MGNFYKDNEDLLFYVEKGIDWAPLFEILEGRKDLDGFAELKDATQFYREVLEMVGGFAADEVAPHAAQIDREGVIFKDGEASFPARLAQIFDQMNALELHGLCMPRDLGGMNGPILLYLIASELLARADVSVMTHFGFYGGIALSLLQYSIEEGTTEFDPKSGKILRTRFQREIEDIRTGREWGSMDITEPHAGSDMAQMKTFAEQDEQGNWYVTGQKIFITSGHGKYHVVIARTEHADANDDPFGGLKGLSVFLVPAYETVGGEKKRAVTIDRVEEKLGQHACVTTALNFDRAPAQLIGKRGEGFKYMLTLMNGARLTVGFMALGICETAYRAAVAYAAERPSMGKTIDRHEMIADYLDEMRTDIQALRALAMKGGFHEEMAHMLTARARLARASGDATLPDELERAIKKHKWESRRITPLLKYFGSEKAVEISRRALQIHGGNGYMKDYPVEKCVRDAVLLPIYEGTSQIQALMAMKDTLGGIMKNPQAFVRRVAQTRWRALSARDPLERRVAKLQQLSLSAQQYLIARTAGDKFRAVQSEPIAEWPRKFLKNWDPKRDFAFAMLHAERLTKLLTDEVLADTLLEQARRFPERRELLERFLDRAEPRARHQHDLITNTGSRVLKALGHAAAHAEPEHRAAE